MPSSLAEPLLTKSLGSRSFNALIWSYAGALSKVLAQLVIQVALARILGPLAFGQAAMVLVFLGFGWLLADGGFGSALIQKAELADADIAFALGWVLLISVLIGAILFGLAPLIASLLKDPAYVSLLRACGVLVPLLALSNIPMSLLRRTLDMKRVQFLNIGSYLVGMGIVGLGLAFAGYGAWSLLIGFAVQTVIILVCGYAAVKFPIRVTLKGDRALRSFGFSVLATNMANWAIDNIDRLIIGKLWGSVSLGEYSAASNLSRAPASILVGAVQSVVFSAASRVQDDLARVRRGFVSATSLVLLMTCPVFAFLALHGELVMHLLYGERWLNAAPLFGALCVAVPSYALVSVVGPTLWAVGAVRSELRIQLLVAGLLVAGLYALAGFPLLQVVWLIPTVYAVRSILLLTALARRIQLPVARVLHAGLGALLLTSLVLAPSLALRGQGFSPLVEAICAAAAGLCLCLLALAVGARRLLPLELQTMLLARAGESALARRLGQLLRLQANPRP